MTIARHLTVPGRNRRLMRIAQIQVGDVAEGDVIRLDGHPDRHDLLHGWRYVYDAHTKDDFEQARANCKVDLLKEFNDHFVVLRVDSDQNRPGGDPDLFDTQYVRLRAVDLVEIQIPERKP
jgi:hypothetical protein